MIRNLAQTGLKGKTITPGTEDIKIPAGMLDAILTILGDTDLNINNVKAGANIFGVQGKSTVVDTEDAVLDANYLLVGYSGYDNGEKKDGLMVDHTFGATGNNYTQAVQCRGDNAGDLFMAPPNGYYTDEFKGATQFGELYAFDMDYRDTSILSGRSIFGIAGTAINGAGMKQFCGRSL